MERLPDERSTTASREDVLAGGWLNQLPAAAAVMSADGRVLAWNIDAARLLGWRAASAAPRMGSAESPWLVRLVKDVNELGSARVMISRRRGAARTSLELRARRTAQGNLLMLMRDVTAQRQAEAGLRATQRRLRLISETVRDHAIVTIDGVGRVASWNASAERLTGFAADDMVRAPFARLYRGTPPEFDALLDAASTTGRSETDVELLRMDGSTFHAQVTITPLSDSGEQLVGFAVVVRDLSERRRAEESLRRSEEQLRHSQKMDAVGRLASGIAHDFNNILTAIQGHVQFLLEDLPHDHGVREDAAEIKKAADRATELTRQLLTFARKQPTRPSLLNVNDVIAGLEKLLRRLIRADVALETTYQDVPEIFADPGQVEQVLVNLVVNARDAIDDAGRISIGTARITLDEAYATRDLNLTPGEYVQISVSDTGTGMSPEIRRQVFEPFFTTKAEGTGLGLPTVYGIVKQAGGHVSVYSEEGIGTTFKIFLPAHGAARGAVHEGATTGLSGTVLLVEDDDAVRALARRALEGNGFAVVEATDGAEALRIAEEDAGSIDAVVTDLTLPRLNGEELAARIQANRPETGVVLMSGFSEMSLVRDGRIREHQRFLEKPFTPAALVRAVHDAMRSDPD